MMAMERFRIEVRHLRASTQARAMPATAKASKLRASRSHTLAVRKARARKIATPAAAHVAQASSTIAARQHLRPIAAMTHAIHACDGLSSACPADRRWTTPVRRCTYLHILVPVPAGSMAAKPHQAVAARAGRRVRRPADAGRGAGPYWAVRSELTGQRTRGFRY